MDEMQRRISMKSLGLTSQSWQDATGDMAEFESRLKAVFEAREGRGQRFNQILRTPDDLVSLVLRGHLVVEELLFAAISVHCQESEHLKTARLRFPQLVALLRALEKVSAVPPSYWTALSELNSLRNALAHILEPQDLASRVAHFVAVIAEGSTQAKFPEPHSSREALEAALFYLIGGLEVVAVWQAAVEDLIRHHCE